VYVNVNVYLYSNKILNYVTTHYCIFCTWIYNKKGREWSRRSRLVGHRGSIIGLCGHIAAYCTTGITSVHQYRVSYMCEHIYLMYWGYHISFIYTTAATVDKIIYECYKIINVYKRIFTWLNMKEGHILKSVIEGFILLLIYWSVIIVM
jgi:hypothetical protein